MEGGKLIKLSESTRRIRSVIYFQTLCCNVYGWWGKDRERNLDFELGGVNDVTVVRLTLLEPLAKKTKKKHNKQSFGCWML